MNWLNKILGILPLVGPVVSGIENTHGSSMAGASKKQLALQALGLAYGVASSVIPGDQAEIDAATQLASFAIDTTVSLFNKKGWPAPPAPVVAVIPQVPAPSGPVVVPNPTAAAPVAVAEVPNPTAAAPVANSAVHAGVDANIHTVGQ